MNTFDETVYWTLAAVSFVTLALSVVVIFRHKFCSPFVILLVVSIALSSFGLLLSALQRAAQHDGLTIGLAPIVAAQMLSTAVLAYLGWDMRPRRPRRPIT